MDRRIKRRQNVEVSLEITRAGGKALSQFGTTRNISTGGGVCFRSACSLEKGIAVEYSLTLSENNPPIRIGCSGYVARCVNTEDGSIDFRYEIALTMERYWFLKASKNTGAEEEIMASVLSSARLESNAGDTDLTGRANR